MITRLVKMTFAPEHVPAFTDMFAQRRHLIRAAQGCTGLQLLQDAANPNVLATLSTWESPEDLERYRQSPLFAETWALTKQWFSQKAEATSFTEKVF